MSSDRAISRSHYDLMETRLKAWFPLDCNGIVKSCDSNRVQLIEEKLSTIENKDRTYVGMLQVTWTTFKFNRNQIGTVSAFVMLSVPSEGLIKATSHSPIFDIPMRLVREDQRNRRRFTR